MGDAIAELVAQVDDPFVRGAAVRAGVAAIFDEHDRRIGRAEEGVLVGVEQRLEPMGRRLGRQNLLSLKPSRMLPQSTTIAVRCGRRQ